MGLPSYLGQSRYPGGVYLMHVALDGLKGATSLIASCYKPWRCWLLPLVMEMHDHRGFRQLHGPL